mmetsp:Transcript_10381/g.15627  ORF Transcript_10381/g.15627 Transcript_10381/m.15627 type:complete len:545 (+) Transcript_10381:273-1907(+)
MATTPSNLPRDDPSLPSVTCAETTSTCTGSCNDERARSSNIIAQSDGGGNDEPMNDIGKDQKQERPTPIHETCTKAEGQHQPQNPLPQQQQQNKPRRVYRRRRRRNKHSEDPNTIPESISQNVALQLAIQSSLPQDYEFEIMKTVHRIHLSKAKHVALQMPEGLLMYACTIADILKKFSVDGLLETVSILGDVTYGACCIDDLGAKALGADLLIHYGHSCLVPLNATAIPCLYIFVEIRVDVQHLVDCFCETCPVGTRVHVMGTVQFRPAVAAAARLLNERERIATVPQAKPLSPGEVLGCTAPANLGGIDGAEAGDTNANCANSTNCCSGSGDCGEGTETDGGAVADGDTDRMSVPARNVHVMLFIADGRFHLEAAMIANPSLRALRYDPYAKSLTDERYETEKMKSIRQNAIQRAMDPSVKVYGIILGTLGRQGNPAILGHVRSLLRRRGKRCFVLLLSEIFPKKLDMFSKRVDVWVQIACPRLSVDWGHFFTKPVLSVYELNVALGEEKWRDIYPMDFYTVNSGRGSNYHENNRSRQIRNE